MNVKGADPNILHDEKSGFFYAYVTTGDTTPFGIYKSKDMINWVYVGQALDTSKNNWAKDWFWAPECYYNPNNGHYYLFYSARLKKELTEEYFGRPDFEEDAKIGVAVSSSPEGPFVNITNRPMDYYPYDPNYVDVDEIYEQTFEAKYSEEERAKAPRGVYLSSIDANLFIDDDGRTYLFYSRCCYKDVVYDKEFKKYYEESDIVAVELDNSFWLDPKAETMPKPKEEYISINPKNGRREDKFIDIINYSSQPQKWENGHIFDYDLGKGGKRNRRWSEGSSTFILNLGGKKTYCLTYSCNHFMNELYGVGIAYSSSPLGPYKKFEGNPIIHQIPEQPVFSTGHGSPIEVNGEWYYLFHGREKKEEDRILYLTKFQVKGDKIYASKLIKCNLMEKLT